MKTTIRNLLFLCLVTCSFIHTKAQNKVIVEDEMPNGIVIVTIDKADEEIIRIINESQLPYFHDPQAPRFLLMDKQGKFALGIGGYVRATSSYDFGGITNNIDFIPAFIPNTSIEQSQFQMDASMASIFLKLVGHTDLLGDFVVYTAGNFRGSGHGFKLRNAYISFRNMTIGYTYGGFMDASAVPTTIDFQGPNGATFYRATQVAYTYKGIKNFKIGIGIESPSVESTATNQLSVGKQRMPDFTLSLQYNWKNNSHLRLAGVIRSMTYTDSKLNKEKSVDGWGIQASTTFAIGKQWRAFGQGTYGKGIAQYMNDLSNLNVDIVSDPNNANRMMALPMLGYFAGLQYNITQKVFLSSTYSMNRLYSRNGYANANPNAYQYGQYLATNAIWSVTPNMQVGAEYLRGWKTNFDGNTRHANRINLLVQYSF